MTMPMQSTQAAPHCQAAQLFAFAPQREQRIHLAPFDNTFEHIQALEHEARLLVAAAALRRGTGDSREPLSERFPFLPEGADLYQVQTLLEAAARENRQREELSRQSGKQLNFLSFCDNWQLDAMERQIILLLFLQHASTDFRGMFEKSGLERNCDDGMEIGVLLGIICPDLRGQMENRRHFSVDSRLMQEELLVSNLRHLDRTTSVARMSVYLNERNARYILGDNNRYHAAFRFISRTRSCVKLEQVMLPDGQKDDVVRCVERYMARRRSGELEEMDRFFGYGTGLALLFHGPSGTGKTMLAAALAHHLDCPLLTLNLEEAQEESTPDDELLRILFHEAALLGGIVLLDECDDLFGGPRNNRLSRALLLELERSRCITIFATNQPVQLDPAMERRIAVKQSFSLPDTALRASIWQGLLPPGVSFGPDVDLLRLAHRYPLSGGQIKNCLLLAVSTRTDGQDGARHLLTQAELEAAADQQQASYHDDNGLCTVRRPLVTLEQVPLHDWQLAQMQGVAAAWQTMRDQGLGLNLLIDSCAIEAGIAAAEGLARDCNCTIHQFDYSRLVQERSPEQRVFDPVTQRRLLPLDYAFTISSREETMLLLVDYEGLFKPISEHNRTRTAEVLNSELLTRLRRHTGLCCIVTDMETAARFPVEFHLKLDLAYPPPVLQLQRWSAQLACEGQEEELQRLVAAWPLHLSEIDYLARQATILAAIGGSGKPTMADARAVLARYRPGKATQLLFGGQRQ